MTELKWKPDLAAVCDRWRKFWAHENERPLICAWNYSTKVAAPFSLAYYRACHAQYHQELLDQIEEFFSDSQFHAEAIPFFSADLGPDQFAAVMGGEITFNAENLATNWVHPFVLDWSEFHVSIDQVRQNEIFQNWLIFAQKLAAAGAGKYFAGVSDLHAGMDALSAMRNPEMLCLDLFDNPEGVAEAMRQVRAMYQEIYLDLYGAISSAGQIGSVGWIPAWCDGKFAVTQCDFGCMISEEDFVKYELPALEEELAFLDHSIYHLDGPGNLRHLDSILQLKDLDGIQWVSGAGQKPMWQWTEVLHKIKDAGKLMQIYDLEIADVKQLHRELGGYRGCFYCLNGNVSEAEVEELKTFLAKN